jgi:hypothetical protein
LKQSYRLQVLTSVFPPTMQSYSSVNCGISASVETLPAARPGAVRKLSRQSAYCLVLSVLFLVSAEMTARLDDWLHAGIPVFSTPDYERDLFLKDEKGTRGRPHGHFKKWRLNAFGFRGPEIAATPTPGCTRIMVLGASETFGLYESDGKEFPAQLADLLGHDGHYEVINAALAGMTVRSMTHYWETWAGQFQPDIVVIYPSPLFYLNDGFSQAPRPKSAPPPAQPEAPSMRSRFVFRMKDVFHVPDFIQKWRTERQIDALISGKSEDWFFREVPPDRLEVFAADLTKLTKAIEKRGARPVLLTHALRTATPLRPEDFDDLHGMRVHLPRASEEILAAFERAAVRAVVAQGAKEHVAVIDVAEVMNGRREWFADLVHFTDEGAAVIGGLVAKSIQAGDTRTSPDQARRRRADRSIQGSNGG